MKDYIELLKGLGLSERGFQIAKEVVLSEPVRRVKSSGRKQNKSVRFPSKKMGFVVQAESFTLEFASVLIKEHDQNVLGFWDQPPGVSISYRSGKSTVKNIPTLDYFVVSTDFIGYEEWKPFSELEKIASKRPEYAYYDSNLGCFVSPAYQKALKGTGLSFRFCTEADLPVTYVENLEFLRGYFSSLDDEVCNDSDIEKVSALYTNESVIRLDNLVAKSPSSDSVYYAIARNELFFPLETLKLQEPSEAWLFDQVSSWEKFKKLHDIRDSHVQEDEQDLSNIISRADTETIKDAVARLELLDRIDEGDLSVKQAAVDFGVNETTIRRWRKKVSNKDSRSEKLKALIGRNSDKGNRDSRLDGKVVEIVKQVIDEFYLDKKALIPHQIHLKVDLRCEELGLDSPSKPTVYKRVDSILEENALLHQKGAKAAYQKSANKFLGEDDVATFTASRYLQYCHIDHTQLDIETIDKYGVPSGRPWLTLCVDEYTGKILSFYISYKNPSYISLMMAIRCMVQTHSVLPESVVVDGGKEFQGRDFEVFCARHRVMIKSREGQPRGGGVVERMFGVTNTAFIHNLEGNTKYMKNVREISRTHNPKNTAEWRFKDLVGALNEFFETFNAKSPKKSTLSPNELALYSQRMFGERAFLHTEYTRDFIFSSLPFIKRRTLTVVRGKNVRANNHSYWNHEFARAERKGTKHEARWDPLDIYHIYVFYGGRWLKCKLSERDKKPVKSDVVAASEELHRESQVNSQAKEKGYKELAKILDQEEKKQAQRMSEEKELAVAAEVEDEELVAVDDDFDDFNLWEDDVPTSTVK